MESASGAPVSEDRVHILLVPCMDPPSAHKADAAGMGGMAGAGTCSSLSPCGIGRGGL